MMSHILYITDGMKNEMNDVHQILHCMRIAKQKISVLTNNYFFTIQYNLT